MGRDHFGEARSPIGVARVCQTAAARVPKLSWRAPARAKRSCDHSGTWIHCRIRQDLQRGSDAYTIRPKGHRQARYPSEPSLAPLSEGNAGAVLNAVLTGSGLKPRGNPVGEAAAVVIPRSSPEMASPLRRPWLERTDEQAHSNFTRATL